MSKFTFAEGSVRGIILGALAGTMVVAATMLFVAARTGAYSRAAPEPEAEGSRDLAPGMGKHVIPVDPAEGEDAAIFAGWC